MVLGLCEAFSRMPRRWLPPDTDNRRVMALEGTLDKPSGTDRTTFSRNYRDRNMRQHQHTDNNVRCCSPGPPNEKAQWIPSTRLEGRWKQKGLQLLLTNQNCFSLLPRSFSQQACNELPWTCEVDTLSVKPKFIYASILLELMKYHRAWLVDKELEKIIAG